MHSFHHSRGRILFEVVCALTVGASCYVAWMQTGAWALLPATAAIGLYSLVRLTDLRTPKPVRAVEMEPQPFREPEPVAAPEPVAESVSEAAEPAVEAEPVAEVVAELAVEAEPAQPKTPRASKPRRTKTMRKGGRRASDESAPVVAVVPAAPDQDSDSSPTPFDEGVHSNIEPLFEPEPFVRMPRPAFGRKAG